MCLTHDLKRLYSLLKVSSVSVPQDLRRRRHCLIAVGCLLDFAPSRRLAMRLARTAPSHTKLVDLRYQMIQFTSTPVRI